MTAHDSESLSVAALRLIYAERVHERDRLRDAQRAVTAQLGPVPASTSILFGVIVAVGTAEDASTLERAVVVGIALLFSAAIVWLSNAWSGGSPYREMLAKALSEMSQELAEEQMPEAAWLDRRISVERSIYDQLAALFDDQLYHLKAIQGLLLLEAAVVLGVAIGMGTFA